MHFAQKEPFPEIYVDDENDETGMKYMLAPKSRIKKMQKIWSQEVMKAAKKSQKEAEDAKKRDDNLEEAKKIKIEEDPSWEPAKRIKIQQGEQYRDTRVKISGWVHRMRRQGKNLMFITLRDGTGFLQCVLADKLCQTYESLILTTESSVVFSGTLKVVPEGKTVIIKHVNTIASSFTFVVYRRPAGMS